MIQFESKDLLHLLWVVVLYGLLLLLYWMWRQRTLQHMGSPALAQRLLLGFSKGRFWLKVALFGVALALVALALANPRRLITRPGDPQLRADVFIAIDVSQSMLAKDVKPNRLAAAKTFALQLVNALEGDRIGLIFFAGDAFPQMPLSTDYDMAGAFIRSADPAFVIEGGSAPGAAIDLAARSVDAKAPNGRGLIILSDGEDHDGTVLQKARKAAADGLRIYTVGFGTASGATLMADAETPRYFQGQIVRTKLEDHTLRDIAQAGKGIYVAANDGRTAITDLTNAINQLQQRAVEAQSSTEYYSYFQWLILPAILLLMLEQILWWRKGMRTVSKK